MVVVCRGSELALPQSFTRVYLQIRPLIISTAILNMCNESVIKSKRQNVSRKTAL